MENFNSKNYEQLSDSLQTSAEILYAIEQVVGCGFKSIDSGMKHNGLNETYALWANGGRETEILAALPVEDGGSPIEDGAEVFWGMEGKFAEFDGEKWIIVEV